MQEKCGKLLFKFVRPDLNCVCEPGKFRLLIEIVFGNNSILCRDVDAIIIVSVCLEEGDSLDAKRLSMCSVHA